jgi:hypothetical protein
VGSASGAAGATVSIPISFDPGPASVAGLQFNLTLPTGLSAGTVTGGPILTAAGKSVAAQQNGNVWTIIVYGLNQSTMTAGNLLTAQLSIAPGTGAGVLPLPISGVVYSDPNGIIVAGGNNTGGNVTVTGGGGGGPLPTPDLTGLPLYAPVNGNLTAGFPTGYTNITFTWTITPATGTPPTSPYGAPGLVISRASAASFSTPSNVAPLSPFSLVPGYYTITVKATDANGNSSGVASKNISLVLADLASVRVYPNPWRSDRHAAHPVITFDQMALGATVKIFTVSGHLVKTLTPAIDTVTWDLTNDSGDKVASGIYIYLVTVGDTGYGSNGQKARGKIAIIK